MRYFFIHVPKAAGSSLITMLSESVGRRFNAIGWHEGQNIIKRPKWINSFKYINSRIISCHANYGIADFLPGKWTYFTFLRRPDERIASHYYFVKQQSDHYLHNAVMKNNLSIEDYCLSTLSIELDNGQTRIFANHDGSQPVNELHFNSALNNLKNHFGFVGLQENFEADANKLFKYLCIKNVVNKKVNTTKQKSKLDSRISNIINERNKYDFMLWEYFNRVNRSN